MNKAEHINQRRFAKRIRRANRKKLGNRGLTSNERYILAHYGEFALEQSRTEKLQDIRMGMVREEGHPTTRMVPPTRASRPARGVR